MLKILQYGKDDTSKVFSRTQLGNKQFIQTVSDILEDVRINGDEALFGYAKKFDNQDLTADNILVSQNEIDVAYTLVSPQVVDAIKRAKDNILDYHLRQTAKYSDSFFESGKTKTSELGWIYRPLARVGLYVPGGKASYPSTVLMTALPAIAAGVKEVVVVTPNVANPAILVACNECGINKIFKVGGAQAIAALAYGTKSIDKVDLIAGPGNVFVTLAKKMVFGQVAIDMIAGPSEILVIADDSAVASYVASDLLSQAEHDELAASIFVTTSQDFALKVIAEIESQTQLLSRRDIIKKSLENNGAIIVAKDMDEAIEI
ncbi:MAG: histidinol dehydrogenase, partial [Clostridia bacterium]